MADSEIRIGKVSAVDYEAGMLRTTYRDKDGSVTMEFPVANFNDEYRMPKVGESVIVAHLSNGSSRGVVLGTVWNQKNLPKESGEHLYRKDLSRKKDAAYVRYDDGKGEYLVKAANLHLNGVNETVLDGPKLEVAANISILIQSDLVHMDFPELVVTGGKAGEVAADVKADIKIDQGENRLEARILEALLEFVENLEVKAGTGVKVAAEETVDVRAGEKMELSSGGELRLTDGRYSVTLTEIMEMLGA